MQGSLSCSAMNCVNNISGLCSARNIHVSGTSARSSSDTHCETFAEKGLKNAIFNLTNMNITGEIRQLFNKDSIEMSPSIKCEAINCNYNVEKFCTARGIQIYGSGTPSSDGTKCETFID